jgi:hypothetical protein
MFFVHKYDIHYGGTCAEERCSPIAERYNKGIRISNVSTTDAKRHQIFIYPEREDKEAIIYVYRELFLILIFNPNRRPLLAITLQVLDGLPYSTIHLLPLRTSTFFADLD